MLYVFPQGVKRTKQAFTRWK